MHRTSSRYLQYQRTAHDIMQHGHAMAQEPEQDETCIKWEGAAHHYKFDSILNEEKCTWDALKALCASLFHAMTVINYLYGMCIESGVQP